MSTYLPIMSILSRINAEEIQVTHEMNLMEKGKVPQGVVMVLQGKVQPMRSEGEILPAPQNRRIWGVKEVWNQVESPFWLRAFPGTSYRLVPRADFIRLMREEPQMRIDVMRMLSTELGIMGVPVTE